MIILLKETRNKTQEFLDSLSFVIEEEYGVKVTIDNFNAKEVISKSDYGFLMKLFLEKDKEKSPYSFMVITFIVLEITRRNEKEKHFGLHFNPLETEFIENEKNQLPYSSKNKKIGVEGVKITGYLPEYTGVFSFSFIEKLWKFIMYSLNRLSQTIEEHTVPDCDFKDYTEEENFDFNKLYNRCVEKIMEKRIKEQSKNEFGVRI